MRAALILRAVLSTLAVINCDCGALQNFESLIWESRFKIAEYLRKSAERDLAEAQDLAEAVKALPIE
jgi:hypothetical protein